MATVLEELGALVRTRPGVDAAAEEVAAWYARKAAMLRHAAAEGGLPVGRASQWAGLAVAHANTLTAGMPAQGKGSALWPVLGPQRRQSSNGRVIGHQGKERSR